MIKPVITTPILAWRSHFDGDLQPAIRRALKETMLMPTDAGSMRGGGRTTANHNEQDPHNWLELREFVDWFMPLAENVWKEWDMQDLPLEFINSWTNVTNNNGSVVEHDHAPAHMAFAFYLQKPKDSGNIELRNINHSSWAYMPRSHEHLSRQDYFQEVQCNSGDLVIFPAWLAHRVQPNKTNENRIVLSGNLIGIKHYEN